MSLKTLFKIVSLATLIFTASAHAGTIPSPAKDRVFVTKEGAIRGYDPVAYFTQGKPVKGSKNITFKYQDAVWHFVSEANRNMFVKDPEHYAPRYGGYCAFGMSQGYKYEVAPEAFTIADGKLYLNYDLKVRGIWKKDQVSHIARADANWPKLLGKPYQSK